MYGLKIPKSQQPDKTPYTVYYFHSIPIEERKWTDDFMQIVSIDPGSSNLAFYIERRYFNGKIIPVALDKVNIEEVKKEIENSGREVNLSLTYNNLTTFLDHFKDLYLDCHYIVIERQLPQNYKRVRISQHIISYFLTQLKDKGKLPSIFEIDSKLKGKMLLAPKHCDLKAWSITKAQEILNNRNDKYSLEVIASFRKKDDLSDSIIQIEALFLFWGFSSQDQKPKLKIIKKPKLNFVT